MKVEAGEINLKIVFIASMHVPLAVLCHLIEMSCIIILFCYILLLLCLLRNFGGDVHEYRQVDVAVPFVVRSL